MQPVTTSITISNDNKDRPTRVISIDAVTRPLIRPTLMDGVYLIGGCSGLGRINSVIELRLSIVNMGEKGQE